jgi:hypothetical protein
MQKLMYKLMLLTLVSAAPLIGHALAQTTRVKRLCST